MVYMTSFFLWC